MNSDWSSTARKTEAFFACLVCGYTGPLAFDDHHNAVCQGCQNAAPAYLVPHCPRCGLYVGMAAARAGAGGRYACPACDFGWQER